MPGQLLYELCWKKSEAHIGMKLQQVTESLIQIGLQLVPTSPFFFLERCVETSLCILKCSLRIA